MKLKLGIVPLYLIFISFIALIVTVYDKVAAKQKGDRVSEKNLMFISVFGGSIVMYITMLIIRHKTRHSKFMIGLPVIILVQFLIVVAIKYFF